MATANTDDQFVWTAPDIKALEATLGRMMMQGKFNPRTWEGENFTLLFVDGKRRGVTCKYAGYVLGEWKKLEEVHG